MSELITLMKNYIKDQRYSNLIKFCDIYKDHVKAYICNFESAESAKKNLQNKLKIVFTNVREKKKEGPGIDIDLKLLYTEARATTAIKVTGCNTLAASVEQLGNAYISNQDIDNQRSDDNDDKSIGSREEDADCIADYNYYDEQDDNNLSSQFHGYKNAAKFISEKHGFYVDGDLHEILSLSDVLLKENEYSDAQINHFGATNLERLRNAVVENYTEILGRATIVNSLLLSICWYLFRVTPITKSDVSKIRAAVSKFMNQRTFPRIK